MIEWFHANFLALLQIIMIDVVLAGDNAVIVGLAASRVAPEMRRRVIFWGIVGAVVLRICLRRGHHHTAGHRRPDAGGRPASAVGVLEDVPGAHPRQEEGHGGAGRCARGCASRAGRR